MNSWISASKGTHCGGLILLLCLQSLLDVNLFFAAFFLERKKQYSCGLEGFCVQAEEENTVDIKLFLLKGIVVARWSSHHSK